MKTNILISRICRLIETAGSAGDGAALADEYAERARATNARLEAVVSAMDAKSISEAIRLMTEDPPLLEEVGQLDFREFSDWENLCGMNGWTPPPAIDRQMTDRVAELGENKDAIAPYLSMYRKAIRVNNVRLAVKSLRRLVDLDQTQDWKRNLRQSEAQFQTQLIGEFDKHIGAGQTDAADQVAAELCSGVWLDGLTAKGADRVQEFVKRREAERRSAQGAENVEILRKCLSEKWDRSLVQKMLLGIDGLVQKGWQVPDEAKSVVDPCRTRFAEEMEQEAKAARWREINETLHAAIQRENCDEIRDALSAPEFLDRDPEGDLLRDAQRVLDHAESARRRKTFQIAFFSFLGLVAVLGVSAWWLRQKRFNERCVAEAQGLGRLEQMVGKSPNRAIAAIEQTLAALRKSSPEVYAFPDVNQFEKRLKVLVANNASRTNRLNTVLTELESMFAGGWANAEISAVTGRIDEVARALTKDDGSAQTRYLKLRDSWGEHVARVERDNHNRATSLHTTLVAHLESLTVRLGKELADADLMRDVENSKKSIDEWRQEYGKSAVDLEAKLAEAEKSFMEVAELQKGYRATIDKVVEAQTADAVVAARTELIEHYGNYPEVKYLKPLDVTADDVKQILTGNVPEVARFIESQKTGISEGDFATFITECVLVIADAPEFASLYALCNKSGKIVAVSKGHAEMKFPSYDENGTISSSQLIHFYGAQIVSELQCSRENRPTEKLMPSSAELLDIVDYAKKNRTIGDFENFLLRKIDAHLKAMNDKWNDAPSVFRAGDPPAYGWMSPYRRVQFIAWYLRWLKEDLKIFPPNGELERVFKKADDLAQPVSVEGVGEGMTWLCLWDGRVQKRTIDCAKFLREGMPRDFTAKYRAARESRTAVLKVAFWKVDFAGRVKFDPLSKSFRQNPEEILLSFVKGVTPDHPVYVLRKVGENLRLVRAFESNRGKGWRKCIDDYRLGEPLYRVAADGKYIDVEGELEKVRVSFVPFYGPTKGAAK